MIPNWRSYKKAKFRVTRQITTYIFGSTVGEQFKHHFRQSPFHMSTFNICVLLQVIHLGALHCFLNFEERIFQCFHCNNANGFKLDFYTGFSYWILLHQIRIFYFYCSDYVLDKCKWQSFFSLFFPQLFDKLRPLDICCWNPQLQSHLPLHCLVLKKKRFNPR